MYAPSVLNWQTVTSRGFDQVVAGTNIFVKVKTIVGGVESFVLLKLFRPLPHTGQPVELTGVQGD